MSVWAINIISTLFHLVFFATPLILWPATSEVFEFNKLIFVYFAAIVVFVTWGFDIIVSKRFILARTPLNLPILLFVLSQVVTTFTSIHPHTSIFGYYSRFHGGLLSTLAYSVLFYAFVTYIPKSKNTFKSFFITISSSLTLVALYAIAERFGIDKHIWIQDVQNRVFSTLGQPNWLAAYLIALIPISLISGASYLAKRDHLLGSFFIFNALIALVAIIFTKSQSGLGATLVILPLTLIYIIHIYKQTRLYPVLLGLALILIFFGRGRLGQSYNSLLKILPFYSTSQSLIETENETRVGGSDSMIIRRLVWSGALDIFKTHPLVGTGPETFAYAYYSVRPSAHNLVSEWDFIYNKAHNEYLNFLATTGILGFSTYIFLIFISLKLFWQARSSQSSSNISAGLLLGYLSILVTNFFGFSVVAIALLFFLFPALLFIESKPDYYQKSVDLGYYLPILIVGWIGFTLFSHTLRYWQADTHYNSGKNALQFGLEHLTTSLDNLTKARALYPTEPTYLAPLSEAQAQASLSLASQLDLPEFTSDPKLRNELLQASLQYRDLAIQSADELIDLHPLHINNFKNKAKVHLILASTASYLSTDSATVKSESDAQYLSAIEAMKQIFILAPTDARSHYNLGLIYLNFGDKTQAKYYFSQAYSLKPDYTEALDQLKALE